MSPGGPRVIVAILCLGPFCTPTIRAEGLHLAGRGGDTDWGETPIVLPIKADVSAGSYVLEAGHGEAKVPAVVFEDGDGRWLGAVLPAVPARKSFAYELKPQVPSSSTDPAGSRGDDR